MPDDFDFDRALAEKVGKGEEAPQEGENHPPFTVTEGAPEGTTPERPRDEHGRFLPKEEETPPPTEGEPEATTDELILGKFRTPEEVVRAYQELEGRLSEQGSELGELRQLRDQLTQQQQQPAQPSLTEEQLSSFDAVIDESPQNAVQLAMQTGNPVLLDRALDALYDENPRMATRIEMARYGQSMMSQIQQMQEPLVQRNTEQEFAEAWRGVQTQYQDVGNYSDKMMEIASESQDLLAALQRPGIEGKRDLLLTLYARAKLEQPQPQQQPAQAAPAPPPERPFTVSGTQAAPHEEAKTGVDQFKDYLVKEEWRSGLNFQ